MQVDAGYAISQPLRKRIEEALGWREDGAPAGVGCSIEDCAKGHWQFILAMAAYDLIRLPKLLARTRAQIAAPDRPSVTLRSPHDPL